MEYNLEPSTSPPRDAASVVLLRDGARGVEVFLLRRHGMSDVLGGAYVFPGGKVDREDADEDLLARLDLAPDAMLEALGEPALDASQAAALYFAGLREAFEETGVLFAATPGADAKLAWSLHREGRGFAEVLEMLSLELAASALQPWCRWITPAVGGVMRKRFDTRFFLAVLPAGQDARHDGVEAVESVWLTPHDALRQYWEREIELAPPQVMSLSHLARHASCASAMDEARAQLPYLVEPHPFEHDGQRGMCYPGDPEHPVRQRAMPGPSRLYIRGGRFEPEGGLQVLLGG